MFPYFVGFQCLEIWSIYDTTTVEFQRVAHLYIGGTMIAFNNLLRHHTGLKKSARGADRINSINYMVVCAEKADDLVANDTNLKELSEAYPRTLIGSQA